MARVLPAVRYNERRWPPPDAPIDPSWSNRRRRRNQGTFQKAVVPRIADLEFTPSPTVASALVAISADLNRFDAQYRGGAPFGAVLLRSESSASSEIEQLTANARRISLARLGDRSRPNATLIARNTAALEAALRLSDELDVDAILTMHRALMEDSDPSDAGRFRQQINWIGGDSPVSAMFVPPDHADIQDRMRDLVKFMKRTDLPSLAQAAIAHAQFETIHPFTDGNGRTGRALVSSLLRARGTTKNFTVPISSGLLTDTTEYFAALDAYRRGDVEPIVEQFIGAATRAMGNVQVLLHDIENLREQIYSTAQRVTKNLRMMADLCTSEPAFTARMVEALGVSTASAYRIIQVLVDHDILRKEHKIRGQSVWSVVALTEALDAFAERAGYRRAG